MENNKKQKLFSALWNLTTTESLHTEEKTVDTRLYYCTQLVNTIKRINRIIFRCIVPSVRAIQM